MQVQNKSPIFIVGCPRSGTTLLQQMLDAHPAVAIAPETHFMQYFWQRQEYYGNLLKDDNYHHLIEDLIAHPEFSEMGLNVCEFSKAAWGGERSYQALFRLLLEQFASIRGVEIIGEKTPNHVLYIPTLKKFFPSARFIHIVRDPRAVVNSWRSVPWSTGSIAGDAQAWKGHVSAPRRCSSLLMSSLFTLHYEQLVMAPEENLRSLCQFLNLEFLPEMLTYHRKESQSVNVTREPWKANSVKPVNQNALTRWQRELSEQMVTEIEAVAWFEMRRFGYKTQTNLRQLVPAAMLTTIHNQKKRISMRISYYIT